MNIGADVDADTRAPAARRAGDLRARHWLLLGLLSMSLHAAVYRALDLQRENVPARPVQQVEIQLVAAPQPAPPPPVVAPPPPPVVETPPPPPPPVPKPKPRPKPVVKPQPKPRPEPPPSPASVAPPPVSVAPTAVSVAPTAPVAIPGPPVVVPREPVYVAPVPVGKVQPNFPLLARRRGWEGTVVVRFDVDTDGKVANVDVAESSGRSVLDEEAVRAVKRRPFKPATRDGVPVTAQHTIRITFKLRD